MVSQAKKHPVVFFSHNRDDRPVVKQIANELKSSYQLDIWIDNWNTAPGTDFIVAMENALIECDAVIAFVGQGGLSPWQRKELQLAIARQVSMDAAFPVIPVLLPGGDQTFFAPEKLSFLKLNSGVKMSSLDDVAALDQIAAGVRGQAPGAPNQHEDADVSESLDSQLRSENFTQTPLEIHSDKMFERKLREQLHKLLANNKLDDFRCFFCKDVDGSSAEYTVRAILTYETPDELLIDFISACSNLPLLESRDLWECVKEIFLLILLRLVNPSWVNERLGNHGNEDLRLFHIAVPGPDPDRGVEIIMARLNARRGGVVFDGEQAKPSLQIYRQYDDSERAAPGAEIAVEQIGQYLLAKFGKEVPDRLEAQHWKTLNAQLKIRTLVKQHAYYLVVPDGDPVYGTADVQKLLYAKMSNLSRFLLVVSNEKNEPLLCDPETVDAAIEAFWDLKPPSLN